MPVYRSLPITISGTSLVISSAQVLFTGGSAAAPSLSFSADTDTGLMRSSTDAVSIVGGGVIRFTIGAGYQAVIGNDSSSASPANGTLGATNGSGTNIAGANLTIRGGQSTGSAAGGAVIFQTSPAGTTGSALNSVTERMRITSNGDLYVGNGDSSATPANSSIRATNGSGTNIGGANLSLYGGLGTGSGNGGVVAFFTSAAGGAGSGLNSATERMRIASDGSVGIGTNAPNRRLTVEQTTAGSQADVALFNNSGTTAGSAVGIVLQTSSDSAARARAALVADSSTSNNGYLALQTRTSGSLSEKVRVKSDGQVRFIPLAADPANAEAGDVYYNSGTNKLRVYNGTAWVDLH
jgi:hypothetical protein